jgi:hypothetical protein
MAAGYAECRGIGFFAKDDAIQFWLFTVASEVDAAAPQWLKEVAREWHREATWEAGDLLQLKLDPLLSHPHAAEVLSQTFHRAMERLAAYGEAIPGELLSQYNISGCGPWWRDKEIRTEAVARIGRAFIDLIAGTLKVPPNEVLFI